MVALIEGRSRVHGREVARRLGVSNTTAWRMLSRLQVDGVTRQAVALRRDFVGGACECLAYLQGRWLGPGDMEAFESELIGDPAAHSAVRITGGYDYRVQAFHPDIVAADRWFSHLLAQPGVAGGKLVFLQTLFDRPCYAAAILGLDGEGDRPPGRREAAPGEHRAAGEGAEAP
ncbi:Lrp/AsnC family transcriptional regulator [Caulobacter mirabilis]|nr:Lrp/AsnC family transcriptional regulator [Caulobacter mirabilis]